MGRKKHEHEIKDIIQTGRQAKKLEKELSGLPNRDTTGRRTVLLRQHKQVRAERFDQVMNHLRNGVPATYLADETRKYNQP